MMKVHGFSPCPLRPLQVRVPRENYHFVSKDPAIFFSQQKNDDDDDEPSQADDSDADGDYGDQVEISSVKIDDGGSDLTDRFKYKV